MTENLIASKKTLEEKNLTLCLFDGKNFIESTDRGVKPLLDLIDRMRNEKIDFSNFSCADKVIGKAAAFLYKILGIKEIFCYAISKGAKELLLENGAEVFFEETADFIVNRKKDGMCPMEKSVWEIKSEDFSQAEEKIRLKAKELASKTA